MATIRFQFEDKSIQTKIAHDVPADMSILEVTEEYDVHLNHNCGGVCACSTCHIYLTQGEDLVEELTDKEEDFIDRAVSPRLTSRLGCQCVLLEGSGHIEATLPDQTQFLGE